LLKFGSPFPFYMLLTYRRSSHVGQTQSAHWSNSCTQVEVKFCCEFLLRARSNPPCYHIISGVKRFRTRRSIPAACKVKSSPRRGQILLHQVKFLERASALFLHAHVATRVLKSPARLALLRLLHYGETSPAARRDISTRPVSPYKAVLTSPQSL